MIMHTKKELDLIERCSSPELIQSYLDTLEPDEEYYKKGEYNVRSFRKTVQDEKFVCLSAALTAAYLLENQGYDPLIMALWIPRRSHAVAIYDNGKIGSIGRSMYEGAEGRHGVFDSELELAKSYADYFRSIDLQPNSFGVVNMNQIKDIDWRFDSGYLDGLRLCAELFQFPSYTI